MKKIPTLFKRTFEHGELVSISSHVTPGFEWVLDGEGTATVKIDGACCAIIGGRFYKRYDAKKKKKMKDPPSDAIPCCDPDPVTGHWPMWVPVMFNEPADKWFVRALDNTPSLTDHTYEAVGPHFQGNPYGLSDDILVPHGAEVIPELDRSFGGILRYLTTHAIEGIVFWKDGVPQCKIKRRDFGLQWPAEGAAL